MQMDALTGEIVAAIIAKIQYCNFGNRLHRASLAQLVEHALRKYMGTRRVAYKLAATNACTACMLRKTSLPTQPSADTFPNQATYGTERDQMSYVGSAPLQCRSRGPQSFAHMQTQAHTCARASNHACAIMRDEFANAICVNVCAQKYWLFGLVA